MEKIKLSEVEKGLPNGIIAQIRGLNSQGEGILEPLDSFLSDILCARGSFIYNSQEVIDNLKKPGVYKHGGPHNWYGGLPMARMVCSWSCI